MLDKMMSQDSWIKSDQYLDRLDWLLGIVSHDWALQVCKHKVLKSWDILIIWIEDGKLLILPLTLQHKFHSDRNRRLIHSCSLNLGLAARGCEKCGARTRSCAEGLASVVLLLQDSRHSIAILSDKIKIIRLFMRHSSRPGFAVSLSTEH